MMIRADTLALAGIRHAFFTREGGISSGCYASLNGGIGSNDNAADVAENRARMAAAVGVEPSRFITAYQVHSPNVVVAETPWTVDARPHADAIVTRLRALAIGVTTADCGPICLPIRKRGSSARPMPAGVGHWPASPRQPSMRWSGLARSETKSAPRSVR